MLRGYIIKSRVRDCTGLLLTQPYSPQLFRQGVMPGPHLLHQVLTHRITPQDAKGQWREHEEDKAEKAAEA